jgi:hypothetical protein
MRRTLWLVGILLFAGLLGLGVVRWQKGGGLFQAQTITLKDGAEITLTAVQFGKRHMDPFAGPQEQFLARLPEALVDRLPLKTAARFGNPANASNTFLSCCLAFPSNVVKGPAFAGAQQLGLWVTEVPRGQTWKSHHSTGRTGVTSTGRSYEVHSFPIFPRRSEWLRVVVTDDPWSGKPLGEFRVRNPGWDPRSPVQTASPLPQPVIQDDLTFTLQSLQVLSNRGGGSSGEIDNWSARLEFTVETAGRPSTNWASYHVARVLDATGNEGDGNSWNHGFKHGRTFVEFSQQPLPTADPWKMEVEFCQRSGFATNELWSLRGVPIQPGTTATARTNRMSGTLVELRSLDVDPRQYRAAGNPTNPDTVVLKLKAKPALDSRRWHLTIVRAWDDQGRDVTDNSWSGSDDEREFRFQVAKDVKSMDFDLAYAPSRMVWFHAQPTVSTNR